MNRSCEKIAWVACGVFVLILTAHAYLHETCYEVVSVSVDASSSMNQKNVFGAPLQPCSTDPITGWYRDGYCKTDMNDHGVHTVCANMTREFLEFTKAKGNDLSTPNPYFPGLQPSDSWCLCALRWKEAQRAGKAPKVNLAATNEASLRSTGITLDVLRQHDSSGQNGVTHDAHPSIDTNSHCDSNNDLCKPQR